MPPVSVNGRRNTAGRQSVKKKNWCFTWNNFDHENLPAIDERMAFPTYQNERGDSGTEHLQGYVQWSAPNPLPLASVYTRKGMVKSG